MDSFFPVVSLAIFTVLICGFGIAIHYAHKHHDKNGNHDKQ